MQTEGNLTCIRMPCTDPECLVCSLTSFSTCLLCNEHFHMPFGTCIPICGDGLLVGEEQCDNLTIQYGCSECQLIDSYHCEGQPSLCYFVDTPEFNLLSIEKYKRENKLEIKFTLSPDSRQFGIEYETIMLFSSPSIANQEFVTN